MEIKKREVLFSVIIVCIMLMLGIFLSGQISYGAARTAEKYATATIIRDHSQFRYGMDTDFGNALVYGDVQTDDPVTFDEIGNGYIYIAKTREDYTRHTRTVTVTDSNGNRHTKTEVYYSWDYVSHDVKTSESIVFLGETFPYGLISLPKYRLDLDAAGVENARWNYIYDGSNTRYYYEITPLSLVGTVFANLSDGTINDPSDLYADKEPEQVIKGKQTAENTYLIVFWIAWIMLMSGAVVGFLYLDNRWLD